MKRLLALAALPLLAIVATSHAQADGTTVTVNHPGWPDRGFAITVDGPVTLTWAGVTDATSTGECTVDHGSNEYVYAAFGATCTGPGAIQGTAQLYADPQCVDGLWLYQMLVVAADGVVVFDDRAHGECSLETTTVATTVPPTTLAPSTTVATRYCAQWMNKPTHHCVRWVTL